MRARISPAMASSRLPVGSSAGASARDLTVARAKPARPAQDDELALLDAERDVAQGGQPHRPAFEDFADVVEPDHGLRPFYLTLQTFGSFSAKSLFTTAGLALPSVDFITCPTRKPQAAF